MDWNCTFTEERLSDHLDGLLSPSESLAFDAHVAACAHCARMVAHVGGLVSRIHNLEALEAPPQLVQKILDATLGPRTEKEGWKRWFAWVPILWAPRFAMGAITVAASFLIVFNTVGLTPNKLRKADLNPGNVIRAANRQVHLSYARGVKFVNDLRVVYEIQSSLQPAAKPDVAPVSSPTPEEQSQPPASTPQQKSEKDPPKDRSQVRGGSMFAVLLPALLPANFTNNNPGSLR